MHFLKVPVAKKLSCLLAALFLQGLFAPTGAFCQELRGAALSDATASYLKRAGFSAQKAPLSPALFTDFPCNITVDFPAKEQNGSSFFLMAAQEDAYENQKFFLELLDWFRAAAFTFYLKVVLTAGDRPKILGNERMAGSEVFCKSVEGMQNAAALILSFDARGKAQVVPGSNGKVSPYYFCRLLCDSMEKNSCPYSIAGGIFLSLYRTKLLKSDPILSSFMDREIPAITLRICGQDQARQLSSVKDFFSDIDVQKSAEWSQHYIPIKIFSKRCWIEESAVIYSVMFFIAAAMFALADFAFIFRRRTKRLVVIKRRALRSNYLIFVTAFAAAISFYLGQGVAMLFQSVGVRNPMVLFVIKLAPAFFIISMIYPLELGRHSRLTTYNYEYILSISAILNIFIFSLFEITLFYLFAIECLLLVLSRAFKSRFSLFIFLAVFITPFLPLLYSILIFSDGPRIYKLIFCGFSQNLLLAFLLVPFNLLWLRILARLNIKAKDRRQKIFGYLVTSSSCFAGLALFSVLVILALNRIFFANVEMPRQKARVFYSKQILRTVAQVYDTEYYGGKIRRIEISSLVDAERFSINVSGKGANPVYFSVYDTLSTEKTAEFLLPDNPPKKVNIIYTPGASSEQDIVINAYYMDHESEGRDCFCETLVFEEQGGEINLRKDGNGI